MRLLHSWGLAMLLLFSLPAFAMASDWLPEIFPDADAVGQRLEDAPASPILQNGEIVGYVFETNDLAPIPAYSGYPVNMRVGMDLEGRITGVQVLDHSEPIMLVGIPETVLDDFVGQYVGKSIRQKVRVGLSRQQREGYEHVDAVSGATVTVVVMGEGIMRSARQLARQLGILTAREAEPATVREDVFEEATWSELEEHGAIGHLHLTRGEVDEAFIGTDAEGVEAAPEGREEETFIDLYFAYLNVPTIGRNLLGDSQYQQLMNSLGENEHALALMADGRYSFKGSGFVRGGIYDRILIHHGGRSDQFRDTDMRRLWGVEIEGAPRLPERDIFILREESRFDPGQEWEVELLVRRQVGALDTEFAGFSAEVKVPEHFLNIPEPAPDAMLDIDEDRPLWVSVWEDRVTHIIVLGAGLGVLTFILLFQDLLAKRPRLLHVMRYSFLVYTVVFIGWYALAQLSVVNIFTFTNALFTDFRWSTFLMDPMMFILWSFVAVSLLLWGRGVYCGWLCPFGAMQELISAVALKLKVPQFELPFAVHERLWALKYIILLGLFAISLQSLTQAEIYAEVEPFKTAVLLKFQREWGFVLYAVLLLLISAFNHKFYCRYVCPLGAGLAIPARIRLFDWLRRHKECGKPCQICANECHIQAIHPDGRINPNECHYCLDCQLTYRNDRKCPPMVVQRKKREKASRLSGKAADAQRIPVTEVSSGTTEKA
ncbi:transcriptional regulator NosR [Billgrantia kenyensis]|uniref:Regulatory protein NosR n=1 Tax=Billgrantia kenyensis TaxID=321266 RepID=A0A7V9W4T7_9GAMM|nr:NosR/NirI family protein [Halomonas kenyensis]MBA2781054.1 regulatory protein NosR [Halomonas kenyensis]MCG6661505.1 regulatory protein NosR [Halomonas kenyensis]